MLASTELASAASVVVRVDHLAPEVRVFVSLCSGGLEEGDCSLAQIAVATGPVMTFTFPDVPPGLYAAAAFQDLNGNGTLDRSAHGLPLEPYGFSNEAGRTGAPRFARAAVRVDRDVVIPVRLASVAGRR